MCCTNGDGIATVGYGKFSAKVIVGGYAADA